MLVILIQIKRVSFIKRIPDRTMNRPGGVVCGRKESVRWQLIRFGTRQPCIPMLRHRAALRNSCRLNIRSTVWASAGWPIGRIKWNVDEACDTRKSSKRFDEQIRCKSGCLTAEHSVRIVVEFLWSDSMYIFLVKLWHLSNSILTLKCWHFCIDVYSIP